MQPTRFCSTNLPGRIFLLIKHNHLQIVPAQPRITSWVKCPHACSFLQSTPITPSRSLCAAGVISAKNAGAPSVPRGNQLRVYYFWCTSLTSLARGSRSIMSMPFDPSGGVLGSTATPTRTASRSTSTARPRRMGSPKSTPTIAYLGAYLLR